MNEVSFRRKLLLSNRGNLLRYSLSRSNPSIAEVAAHGDTFRGRPAGIYLVPQPVAGTRAGVREEPRSLEGEVPGFAATGQGIPHRDSRPASLARSVASQGGGPGTGDQRTAYPIAVAAASRAVPPASSRRSQPALTRLSS